MDPIRWLAPTTQPVVDTSAYATGDSIGAAVLEFPLHGFKGSPSLLIQSALLVDQDKENVAFDLILFDSSPSGTTLVDNTAADIADADMAKIIGVIQFTTYASFNDNSVAFAQNLALPVRIDPTGASPVLYAILVVRGGPTYTAATDLKLRLGFMAV